MREYLTNRRIKALYRLTDQLHRIGRYNGKSALTSEQVSRIEKEINNINKKFYDKEETAEKVQS